MTLRSSTQLSGSRRWAPAALAAALSLAACSDHATLAPTTPSDPPPAPPRAAAPAEKPTTAEQAIADKYAAALAGPLAGLGPILEPDAIMTFPGFRRAVGRVAVVQAHERLFGAFSQRKVTLRRVLKTAQAQTLEWTLSGVMTRDGLQMHATNTPVVFDGLTVLITTDAGTLVELHTYFDVARVGASLGQGPLGLRASARPVSISSDLPRVVEQSGSTVEASNAATVRGQLDALEAGDLAHYLGTMTDDVVVTPIDGEPMSGKAAARRYFAAMHASLAQLDTTISNEWAVGPFVVVEYTINGIQTGPIDWVPVGHDRVVTLHVADVVELGGGHVVRVTRYENEGELTSEDD